LLAVFNLKTFGNCFLIAQYNILTIRTRKNSKNLSTYLNEHYTHTIENVAMLKMFFERIVKKVLSSSKSNIVRLIWPMAAVHVTTISEKNHAYKNRRTQEQIK
jgi:hypothetical protein